MLPAHCSAAFPSVVCAFRQLLPSVVRLLPTAFASNPTSELCRRALPSVLNAVFETHSRRVL